MKLKKIIIYLFFSYFIITNSFSLEPDIFVQSTVNRASAILSKDISKDEKIKELKKIAKETAELLSEVVSKPTALRMRYLIEQSKDELLESYKYTGSLIHVIQLAYAFQAYCEIPDTEGHNVRLHEYIEAYI